MQNSYTTLIIISCLQSDIFFIKIGPKWIYTSYENMYAFFWYLGPAVCAHLKRKEFTTIYLLPSSLVGSLPHMATHYYRKVVLKLQSNLYKPSTAGSWMLDSTIFWVVRFCTIRGIALIEDWFSTKTCEIGQFEFQSPLFYRIFMWKNLLLILNLALFEDFILLI